MRRGFPGSSSASLCDWGLTYSSLTLIHLFSSEKLEIGRFQDVLWRGLMSYHACVLQTPRNAWNPCFLHRCVDKEVPF